MSGYRSTALYMKSQGKNEKTRLVEISDIDAANLEGAFRNMWIIAGLSEARKPLHHISINPFKDERLSDTQLLKIVERCEKKYGYKSGDHQRVIIEHIKNDRQHFHVVWNRVSLKTGHTIQPGDDWKKARYASREMEKELGLKRPVSRRMKRALAALAKNGRRRKILGRYDGLKPSLVPVALPALTPKPKTSFHLAMMRVTGRFYKKGEDVPFSGKPDSRSPEEQSSELLIWAWENRRIDILRQFGLPVVVAVNRFPDDSDRELDEIGPNEEAHGQLLT